MDWHGALPEPESLMMLAESTVKCIRQLHIRHYTYVLNMFKNCIHAPKHTHTHTHIYTFMFLHIEYVWKFMRV